MFSLQDAVGWVSHGRLSGPDGERTTVPVAGVSTDTRSLAPGELFVALRGERFDGHAFIDAAVDAGAVALLVDAAPAAPRVPALVVPDTRVALGEIATRWRARFRLPVIAVTGSNGKTTVKEMIAAILAARFGEEARLATRGNLNNEIGLPLTLFRLCGAHEVAVLELGMNQPGEIARLARIAQPSVGLVSNAQREHQEFMHTVEAVARENGAVIEALDADGVAVFPADDAWSELWRSLAGARRRVEFGRSAQAPVWAEPQARPDGFELHVDGRSRRVSLAIAGRHNVHNALAAAACAHAVGVPIDAIVTGLECFRPLRGRLARHLLAGGVTLVDDSYNANPDSVRAAIELLADAGGRAVLVLGDMGEVGSQGPAFHAEVGAYAAERGIARLLAFGPAAALAAEAFGGGGAACDSIEAVLAALDGERRSGTTILVKGSRSMRMERVVDALLGSGSTPPAGGAAEVH